MEMDFIREKYLIQYIIYMCSVSKRNMKFRVLHYNLHMYKLFMCILYIIIVRPVAWGKGAIPPPPIFSLPPNRVGLFFRIFVCIHLLCKINVQYTHVV